MLTASELYQDDGNHWDEKLMSRILHQIQGRVRAALVSEDVLWRPAVRPGGKADGPRARPPTRGSTSKSFSVLLLK